MMTYGYYTRPVADVEGVTFIFYLTTPTRIAVVTNEVLLKALSYA